MASVSEERVVFDIQEEGVVQEFRPYTVLHPLRPFLGIGYGKNCWLKGSGVGKGHDTDSGSYSFLKEQARFLK
jgi:regulator-associated protein of mTOR